MNKIHPDLFARLLDHAKVLRAFIDDRHVMLDDDDDRDASERAADFVADHFGYTSRTTPTFEEVSSALYALVTHFRSRPRVDDAPDFTP